jgi:hypothetical protein
MPDWLAIRTAYVTDAALTLKSLAQRFNVPLRTLAGYAARGKWHQSRKLALLPDALASQDAAPIAPSMAPPRIDRANIAQDADRRAARLLQAAASPALFVARVQSEAVELLDTLKDRRATEVSARATRDQVGAWKDVVSVARQAYGLDSADARPVAVRVGLAISVSNRAGVDDDQAIEAAIDVSSNPS